MIGYYVVLRSIQPPPCQPPHRDLPRRPLSAGPAGPALSGRLGSAPPRRPVWYVDLHHNGPANYLINWHERRLLTAERIISYFLQFS